MWNPFKKKDPLEGQRANYALAFDIVPKVLNAFIGSCSVNSYLFVEKIVFFVKKTGFSPLF